MKNPDARNTDKVLLIFITIILIIVIGVFFFPHSEAYYPTTFSLVVSCFWMYTGIKKIGEASANGKQVKWYIQPSILLGIGSFLGVLWNLLQFKVIPIFPYTLFTYTTIENILLSLGLLLYLLAIISFFKNRS